MMLDIQSPLAFPRRQIGPLVLAMLAILAAAHGAGAPEKARVMERYEVNETHLLSFGLAITLWEEKSSGRVLEMYIKDVAPGSMAEAKGLRPGTRIWAIDAVPVDSFEATFDAGSELGKKFLNRSPHDKIVLEVAPMIGERHTRVVVLEQSPFDSHLTVTNKAKPPPADWNWKPEKKD